jgi:crotonobetaine/carnitine-CoA ligase
MDVTHLLRLRAATRRDHPFLIWEPFEAAGEQLTYAAFEHKVRACADGMRARGVAPGDAILIHLEKCPDLLIAWFACACLGAIAVTTNARASAEELAYFAGHSGATAAITQPRFAEIVTASSRDLKWIALTDHDNGVPAMGSGAPAKAESFALLLGDADRVRPLAPDPARPPSACSTRRARRRGPKACSGRTQMRFGARRSTRSTRISALTMCISSSCRSITRTRWLIRSSQRSGQVRRRF